MDWDLITPISVLRATTPFVDHISRVLMVGYLLWGYLSTLFTLGVPGHLIYSGGAGIPYVLWGYPGALFTLGVPGYHICSGGAWYLI